MKHACLLLAALFATTSCTGDHAGPDNNGDVDSGEHMTTSDAGTSEDAGTNRGTNNGSNTNSNSGSNSASNNSSNPAIWRPAPGTTWQWQLSGDIDTSIGVEMYDIDLFDVPVETMRALQQDGRIVVCYFSAGTREEWRDDADQFETADYGNELPDWPGEFWVDVRSSNVRQIMSDRLDLAVQKGCDGVEPDNVDGVSNDPGFDYTEADQLDYNRFLADEAHARGLSIGLKNALEFVDELEPHFDWALNEECLDYAECNVLQPFLDAGKAVFHAEYVDEASMGTAKQTDVCPNRPAQFSTLIKTWDLDAWYLDCP